LCPTPASGCTRCHRELVAVFMWPDQRGARAGRLAALDVNATRVTASALLG
jgi:hypothetical protein